MNGDTSVRIQRLNQIMRDRMLDLLLLTDGYNMHYISGYRGHTGCMLVFDECRYILTDARYTEQAALEAPEFVCIDIKQQGYAKTVKYLLEEYCNRRKRTVPKTSADGASYKGENALRIGFENREISYSQYKVYTDILNGIAELIPLDGVVDEMRQVKTEEEIERIAKAESIGDMAFSHIIKHLRVGMTELEIAAELEYVMKRAGAAGLSFDTIAASGKNSSLPHAMPSSRALENGDFLTMDFGCIYEGYCSDMTRTVLIGDRLTKKQKEIYDTVLRAQLAALAMIRPGVRCSEVDECARSIIRDAGYGEYFGHGLGHSVGLFIHEEPRLSARCDAVLQTGVTVTVEPGIYLTGEFGVRIEDLVVVTENGYRNLTASPKELIKIA